MLLRAGQHVPVGGEDGLAGTQGGAVGDGGGQQRVAHRPAVHPRRARHEQRGQPRRERREQPRRVGHLAHLAHLGRVLGAAGEQGADWFQLGGISRDHQRPDPRVPRPHGPGQLRVVPRARPGQRVPGGVVLVIHPRAHDARPRRRRLPRQARVHDGHRRTPAAEVVGRTRSDDPASDHHDTHV
ncbi:hypothetical protein OIE66_20535 [Nonomuraea sp. NBC_01738]|nr:hypothetical protein OIE66_20535 [Nonomuraea sp. NBC_01738]